MARGDRAVYSIGAVARLLGVPPATLRSWQERYGLVVPERSAGGQRLFSREQLEQLRFVAAQIDSGVSTADAHRLLEERRASGGPLLPLSTAGEEQICVLLAERDPRAAEFAEFFLQTEGYAVLTALDVETAEVCCAERPVQLAVVDLLLSAGAGLRLCTVLKERWPGISLVAVSTFASRDDAVRAGADAFLQKPVDPLQLVSTVKDLLGRSAFLQRGGL